MRHKAIADQPQAVAGRVNANTTPTAVLSELKTTVEEFKASHDNRLQGLGREVEDMKIQLLGLGVNGFHPPEAGPAQDPAYTELFASYARSGSGTGDLLAANRDGERAKLNASMTTSPGEAGGFLAPIEWDRQVRKAQLAVSPMRQIASVVPTSVRGYSTIWNLGGWGSGWVGETASRPATNTAELKVLTFSHGEIYAFPLISQQLVDDADFNLETWLTEELSQEFARQEGAAFLSGDGVNKPNGLLTYVTGGASAGVHPGGNIATVPSGAAGAVTADGLVKFVYALTSPYRQGARWLMNSNTAAAIALLKDGQGAYLWRESYIVGQPATLLGYPVTIDEGMPDVASGATPIAFGDFKRAYVINDRVGIRVLRDPFTVKPFVGFYTTKRVGGGLMDPNAIRLLKIAAS